jgi:VCBS repeat-containing protein
VDHGDGTFSYDPGSHFVSLPRGATATDTFQYILSDANGATATSTVTVRITGQNQRPVANVDTVDLDENAGETVLTPQLLRNDADPDLGDRASLRITAIQTSGTQGTVTLSIDGTVKYTPSSSMPNLAPGDGVLDSFEYTVSDPSGGASTARATLRIQGRNEAPVTVRDTVAIAETASGTDITAVLLSNDWDPDPGQTSGLRVIGVDRAGTIGSLTFVGGRVQYSPNGRFETLSAGAVGVDQFRYQVADPAGATAWNVVTVNVQGINSAPIAANDYPVIELKTSATDPWGQRARGRWLCRMVRYSIRLPVGWCSMKDKFQS